MKLSVQYKRLGLFLLIAGVTQLNSFAQEGYDAYRKVSISSPTAASLGKYADIPVNYHTGIPQISIPIYTIKEGPLEVPVSLSYHASGLKVMEAASWVGAGWALNAGGVITRTVRGTADEKNTQSQYQKYGHFTDFGYQNYLYRPISGGDVDGIPLSRRDEDILMNYKDGEPDLFMFNFGGYSGKFYFHDDRTPVLVPEQDIKIEYDYTGATAPEDGLLKEGIRGFIITTPDGVKYYFGSTGYTTGADPIEITRTMTVSGGLSLSRVVSSWYLNKIVSPDQQFAITFTYTAELYSLFTLALKTVPGGPGAVGQEAVKMYVNGVRLNQINFSSGKIDFNADVLRQDVGEGRYASTGVFSDIANGKPDGAKLLNSIAISDKTALLKKYIFAYDYFSGANSTKFNSVSAEKRLKLLSLQEQSWSGTNKPAHIFSYYDDTTVPGRLSLGQDHWGFINGVTSNTDLIPAYTVINSTTSSIIPGANRDPGWPAMRAGTLKSIKYPTGGNTDFQFESNYAPVASSMVQGLNVIYSSSGWEGNPDAVPSVSQATLPSGTYKIKVTNGTTPGTANLKMYASATNSLIANLVASPGSSSEQTVYLDAGTYRQELLKTTPYAGSGAEGSTYAMTVGGLQNVMIGGLRIKQILNYESLNAQPIITDFGYNNSLGLSNGILFSRPTYAQVVRNDIIKEIGFEFGTQDPNGCVTSGQAAYNVSAGSLRPMETSQGYHIGYSEVKVSKPGNGYSIYQYYGSNSFQILLNDVVVHVVNNASCDPLVPSYPDAPLAYDYYRGLLKYDGQYNQAGQVLQAKQFEYQFLENPKKTPGYIVANRGSQYLLTRYDLKTYKKTQTKVTNTTTIPGGGAIITTGTTDYSSPYHYQPSHTVSTNSRGEVDETVTKYASDFRLSNVSPVDYYTPLISACASCDYAFNNGGGTAYARWQIWTKCMSDARKLYVANSSLDKGVVNSRFLAGKLAADVSLKPILELQSQYQVVPIESTSWKNGKLLSGSFTRFNINSGTLVYPDLIQKLNPAIPSAAFTASATAANNISLIKDPRYTDEDALKFAAGNLVEMKHGMGNPVSYLWGYNKQYPVAEITGADIATVSSFVNQSILDNINLIYTDQQIRNELDKIRTGLVNAQVRTFTYKPATGMTSMTDARGQTTFYEYDESQRLKNIKDQDGNIVKNLSYNYANQQALVYYSAAKSGSITRNNCGIGYISGPAIPFSIPESKYTASTQVAADLLALNDYNTNGQINANINGTCINASSFIVNRTSKPEYFKSTGDANYTTISSQATASTLFTNITIMLNLSLGFTPIYLYTAGGSGYLYGTIGGGEEVDISVSAGAQIQIGGVLLVN
jgi:YD repeat-containing protein